MALCLIVQTLLVTIYWHSISINTDDANVNKYYGKTNPKYENPKYFSNYLNNNKNREIQYWFHYKSTVSCGLN